MIIWFCKNWRDLLISNLLQTMDYPYPVEGSVRGHMADLYVNGMKHPGIPFKPLYRHYPKF